MLVDKGEINNLVYHNVRINKTLSQLSTHKNYWDINDIIKPYINKIKKEKSIEEISNYKARILYDLENVVDVSITPYIMRKVNSLRCVEDNRIDYSLKRADRSSLNELFALRGKCDDVLIIKDGLVTDTTICNVALWNGEKWLTPRRPLLKGTKRESLLDNFVICENDIYINELKYYSKIRLFNALIRWGEIELDLSKIFF